jgi:endonuclease G
VGSVLDQIAKAEERASGTDVRALADGTRDRSPGELAGSRAKALRHSFLVSSLGDANEAQGVFERILEGNELQPVSYLERGAIAARAVCRIAIRSASLSGWGTGFLISPQVLLTNNHVLPDSSVAAGSLAQFRFELDLADRATGPVDFALDPDRLFETSVDLDYTAVAVRPIAADGRTRIEQFGFLPLIETGGKAFEGEWLTIVQHPAGERKQLCVRENRLIKRAETVLWYSTDTLAGSSGSPVFNNDWFVVALHHSGIPERRNGVVQTIDGHDYMPGMDETRIKWVANEGVRASRISAALRTLHGQHPLLQPMFRATPASARIQAPPTQPSPRVEHATLVPRSKEQHAMDHGTPNSLPMEVRLRIEVDGSARIVGSGTTESLTSDIAIGQEGKGVGRAAAFSAPFDEDYQKRKGFDPLFLGKEVRVDLPVLSASLQAEAAPLLPPGKTGDHVLRYHNFSVVMHAARRMAIYSAANVDFANRYDMSRPPDVWRRDPRIRTEHQLEGWYYLANNFDRGHLTRREDLEFGPSAKAALISAADTCHWTNCSPQHARFNQNKQVWQGIERYVLEATILGDRPLRAQVITGPVLDEGDPEYKKIQYPLQFWKVVAALDEDGELFATAYLASQEDVIAQHGIEAAPFGAFKTFQTTVAEIERLTGLQFRTNGKPLSQHDPLSRRPRRRRARGEPGFEAAAARAPQGYWPLTDIEDIVL